MRVDSLEAISQRVSLSKLSDFERSLPLIDDNRKKVLSSKQLFGLCAFTRQNEGNKQ